MNLHTWRIKREISHNMNPARLLEGAVAHKLVLLVRVVFWFLRYLLVFLCLVWSHLTAVLFAGTLLFIDDRAFRKYNSPAAIVYQLQRLNMIGIGVYQYATINHRTQFATQARNSLISRTENANYGDHRTQFLLRLPLDGYVITLILHRRFSFRFAFKESIWW